MAIHLRYHGTNPRRVAAVSWKAASWWLSGLLAMALVVAVSLHFTELSRLADALSHIHLPWAALALVIQVVSYACAAGVWYLVARRTHKSVSFLSLIPLDVGYIFARQAVPSAGVSGSLLLLKGFANRGIPKEAGAACLMINLVSFYIAYAAAVTAGMAIFAAYSPLSHKLMTVGLAVLGVAAAIPMGVLALWRMQSRRRTPELVKKWDALRNIYETLKQAPAKAPGRPLLIAQASLLQLGVFLADTATLYVVLLALGHPPAATLVFAAHVMSNAIATLAPVPLGLGTYEGACIFLLHHRAGAPVETALAATLIFRGLAFWLPMLPGFFITRHELKHG